MKNGKYWNRKTKNRKLKKRSCKSKTENKKEVRKQNENSRKPAENEVNYVSGIFIKICRNRY